MWVTLDFPSLSTSQLLLCDWEPCNLKGRILVSIAGEVAVWRSGNSFDHTGIYLHVPDRREASIINIWQCFTLIIGTPQIGVYLFNNTFSNRYIHQWWSLFKESFSFKFVSCLSCLWASKSLVGMPHMLNKICPSFKVLKEGRLSLFPLVWGKVGKEKKMVGEGNGEALK